MVVASDRRPPPRVVVPQSVLRMEYYSVCLLHRWVTVARGPSYLSLPVVMSTPCYELNILTSLLVRTCLELPEEETPRQSNYCGSMDWDIYMYVCRYEYPRTFL